MNKLLSALALTPAAFCLTCCGGDHMSRETLAADTHTFLHSVFGDTLTADSAYFASCYDNPANISLIITLLAIPVEQSFYGSMPQAHAPIDRAKGQQLLSAWLQRGIDLRDPLTMLFCVRINTDPALGVMNMSEQEASLMAQDAFFRLRDTADKNADQWLALLMCYAMGEGTAVDMDKAKEIYAFLESEAEAGHIKMPTLSPKLIKQLKRAESTPAS